MEIGQQVKVVRLRDRVSAQVSSKLGQVGIIKKYKMVDGSGVGLMVEFTDKTFIWFFDDEVKPA